jgi:hypothetical protein
VKTATAVTPVVAVAKLAIVIGGYLKSFRGQLGKKRWAAEAMETAKAVKS